MVIILRRSYIDYFLTSIFVQSRIQKPSHAVIFSKNLLRNQFKITKTWLWCSTQIVYLSAKYLFLTKDLAWKPFYLCHINFSSSINRFFTSSRLFCLKKNLVSSLYLKWLVHLSFQYIDVLFIIYRTSESEMSSKIMFAGRFMFECFILAFFISNGSHMYQVSWIRNLLHSITSFTISKLCYGNLLRWVCHVSMWSYSFQNAIRNFGSQENILLKFPDELIETNLSYWYQT